MKDVAGISNRLRFNDSNFQSPGAFVKGRPLLPESESELTGYLFRVGHAQARHLHMREDDAEEAALVFVEKVFGPVLQYQQENGGRDSRPRWLYRAAHNHVLNFLKAMERQRQETVSLSMVGEAEAVALVAASRQPTQPEEVVLQTEFRQQLMGAVRRLGRNPRNLFIGFYFHHAGIAELARRYGRTEAAVMKSLERSRKQVRKWMQEQGY